MSIAYMNMFTENIISGRGFIAVSVVIFARFIPIRAMWGALLLDLQVRSRCGCRRWGLIANQLMLMLSTC